MTPIPAGQLKAFDADERGSGAAVDPTVSENKQVLARGGEGGFRCYRIPALATNNDGEIIAQWDGRPNNCGDSPEPNSIVQKTSADNGTTFGAQTVAAAGQPAAPRHGYSDPSLIVDRKTGHVYSFFVKSYDQGIWGSQLGTDPSNRNVLHAVYVKSTDGGHTWGQPVFVTDAITKGHENEWKGRFATSGNGIQLLHGTHAGRLLQPYSVWNKNGQKHAVVLYSDDDGATWHRGEPLGDNFDENKLVELSDGSVMINSRQTTRHGDRYVAVSQDGGQTWGSYKRDPQLVDPGNNASIIRPFPNAQPDDPKAKMLLFSNSANRSSRVNGTIKLSCDDGQTWTAAKQFKDGAMAYSVMSVLGDGNIGILYEAENNDITFARFNMDWLGGTCAAASVGTTPIDIHRDQTVQVPVTITNPGPGALASGSVTITGLSGWTFGTAEVTNLEAGQSTTVNVSAKPYPYANAGQATGQVVFTVDGSSSSKQVTFNVILREGEFPVVPVAPDGVTVVSHSSQQNSSSDAAANAVDGRPNTSWHTSWTSPVPLPHQITIDYGAVHQGVHLSILPRQDASLNGQIKDYEIWAGETQEGMTKVSEGTWDTSKAARIVPLNGANVRFVKVVSKGTYGDQLNKWTSLAEVTLYSLSDVAVSHLTVVDNGLHSVVKANDADENTYSVGDKLRWTFRVTNSSTRRVTSYPRSGNFSNFAPPAAPNCRWANLEPNASYTCASNAANAPFHTLTAEDMERGYFVSQSSWDATTEREGTVVLSTTVPEGKRVILRPFNATLDTTKFQPKENYTVGEVIVIPIRVKGQELRANRYNVEAVAGDGLTTFTGTYASGSGTDRCGWNNVHGEDGYTCYPKYTVKAEDLEAGYVVFNTSWKARRTGSAGINAEYIAPIRIELPSETALQTVTPAAPTFVDNDATADGDKIVIPTVEGVVYTINDEVVTGEITDVQRGVETVVVAEAADGYILADGATAEWSHTFAVVAPQPTVVAPVPVRFVDPDGEDGDKIVIPTLTGVVYKIDGQVVSGDVTNVKRGVETVVVAEATEGYVLAEGATAEWRHTFAAATPQPTVVTPQAVEFVDPDGEAGDKIVIPTLTGVVYKIDGQVVSGDVTNVKRGVETVVVAEATEGHVLAEGATAEWRHTFAAATPQPTVVTPQAVEFVDPDGEAGDKIVIPAVAGVVYKIDGQVVSGEVTNVKRGVETVVVAEATEGYVLAEGATAEWRHTFAKPAPVETTKRVFGADRVQTAIKVMEQGKFGKTAVLASGRNYADALAAGPLAAAVNGPVLLTSAPALEADVLSAMLKADIEKVYITGGTSSVPAVVERALKRAGITVVRLGGSSRFETAQLITGEVNRLAPIKRVFVVDGLSYADGLSAGAVASLADAAIVLSNGDQIDRSTQIFLQRFNGDVVAVGYRSAGALTNAGWIAGQNLRVIGGEDRYATALRLAEAYAPDAKNVVLVSGQGYADALSGAALAANRDGILLLTGQGALPNSVVQYLSKHKPAEVTILGGTGVVNGRVEGHVRSLLK
ncbi:cell wall-binding repeat-containing protein [Buchananella felis]|uniref:cell wall-binding repeat-containing protein n=1 Tax=Buchananella felis TaxID=3231492 RepID=UPI003527BC21